MAGSDFMDEYQGLLEVDQKLAGCCEAALQATGLIRLLPQFVSQKGQLGPDVLLQNAALVGSAQEGVILPRMLGSRINSLEADVMFRIANMDAIEAAGILLKVTNKPGIYKVDMEKLFEVLPDVMKRKYKDVISDDRYNIPKHNSKYLSGMHVKDIIEKIIKYKDDEGTAQAVATKIFGRTEDFRVDSQIEFHGPSTNLILNLKAGADSIMEFSLDGVPYLQLNFWHEEAEEWIYRERQWPPKGSNLISMATQSGCQLVSKPQKRFAEDGKGRSTSLPSDEEEWRLTFTKAENILARSRSPEMKLVYMTAKCIFYKHLDIEVRECKFSSYCLKTVMMWMVESTFPEEWASASVLHMVQSLFKKLQASIKEGFLPYYFIPKINLLLEYPKELLNVVLDVLEKIVLDISDYLPGRSLVQDITRRAESVVQKWHEAIAQIVQVNLQECLKREQSKRAEREISRCNSVQCYDEEDLD